MALFAADARRIKPFIRQSQKGRMLEDRIAEALRSLIGLPLSAVDRSAGLAQLQFGALRPITDRRGRTGTVGTYALHLQCTWRIVGPTGMIVGWEDHYFAPGDDPHAGGDTFDWEVPAITRFDERVKAFLAEWAGDLPIVKGVRIGAAGSFHLDMSGDTAIEVFPTTSFGEHWRVFRPGDLDSHVVVTDE